MSMSRSCLWQRLKCDMATGPGSLRNCELFRSTYDDGVLSEYNRRLEGYIANADFLSLKDAGSAMAQKTITHKKKHSLESNRGTVQWLMWGLRCVVAHCECSSAGTATSDSRSVVSALHLIDALTPQNFGRKIGMWEMMSCSFAQIPPWRVKLTDVHIYGSSGEVFLTTEKMKALPGSIVGLGIRSSGKSVGLEDCIGVGMIRALNASLQLIYILAPLSPLQLKKVDCLLVRDSQMHLKTIFNSPASGFVSGTPYMCSNGLATEGTGARAMRSRNNIARR